MGALVPGEVTGLAKSLVTAWPVTGVGSVPGMGALVCGEVTGAYWKKSCGSLASHRPLNLKFRFAEFGVVMRCTVFTMWRVL